MLRLGAGLAEERREKRELLRLEMVLANYR